MRLATPIAVAVAAAALTTQARARTWEQAWDVGPHPAVQVQTNDARVRLHAGPPGRVAASVEYTVQVWGLHSTVHEPEVRLERQGDSITIVARTHGTTAVFGGVIERFHVDVTLPPGCAVQARSGDGAVECDSLRGALDLESGDGHITVHGARGEIRLTTGDGGIDADGLDGALDARSGDGHLRVSGRFDRLDLAAGDGHLEATALRGSVMGAPWSVTGGDGGVMLRIPHDLQAMLDAVARDGPLRVELPIDTRGTATHHALRGQLNGGHVLLWVRSGDGALALALSD